MGNLIEDLLKGLDDNLRLVDEMQDIPALDNLLKNYRNYRNKFDATLPDINEDSLGIEFKNALKLLPPSTKLIYLTQYHDELNNKPVPVAGDTGDSDCGNIAKTKNRMMGGLLILFVIMIAATVLTFIYLMVNGSYTEEHASMTSIFGFIVEMMKLLIGI